MNEFLSILCRLAALRYFVLILNEYEEKQIEFDKGNVEEKITKKVALSWIKLKSKHAFCGLGYVHAITFYSFEAVLRRGKNQSIE